MPKLSARSETDEVWEGYDRPPAAEERLVQIYTWWREKHRSEHIPLQPLEAARWWIDRQEAPNEWAERPERTYDKRGNFSGWRTPYHDRVASNFRLFLALNEPQKAFVLDHIEQGIPWRGDSIERFKLIVAEHFKMMENPEEYLAKAQKIHKEVTRANT